MSARAHYVVVAKHVLAVRDKLLRFGQGGAVGVAAAPVMLNVHVTHHAGTALCAAARLNTKAPDFACSMDKPLPPREFLPWARHAGYGFVASEFQGGVPGGWKLRSKPE